MRSLLAIAAAGMLLEDDNFAYSGGLDWKTALRKAGAADLLKNTPLEEMGNDLGFWLYELETVMPKVQQQAAKTELGSVMSKFGETLGRPQKVRENSYAYKTISVAPWPCRCADWYGGLNPHAHNNDLGVHRR